MKRPKLKKDRESKRKERIAQATQKWEEERIKHGHNLSKRHGSK